MSEKSSALTSEHPELSTAKDWLLTHFAEFEKGLNGEASHPFFSIRKEALGNYSKVGFPHSKLEEWKYTNPAPIKDKDFPLFSGSKNPECSKSALQSCFTPGLDSYKVNLNNGIISELPPTESGISVQSLKDARKNPLLAAILDKHLAKIAKTDQPFVAINTALLAEVLVVRVEANKKITLPLEILVTSDVAAEKKTLLPRILVVVEKNSELSVVERYKSLNSSEYCNNSVVEFYLSENAHLSHYRIQDESVNAFHLSTISALLEANSNFQTFTFSFGGRLVRNDVNLALNGANCNVVMNGLTAITGCQHVDNHTLLDNLQPNCESNELYKGIYGDSSQGVFSGSIIVRQEAQKTNAIQSNKSLLLSDRAQVNSKPQLKIWADDVKCTHGATVGQLDEDAMFYIRSRGVSESDARVMLIHAFASEVISAVKLKPLKENLEHLLLEKLNLES